jgi:hypothetical protein
MNPDAMGRDERLCERCAKQCQGFPSMVSRKAAKIRKAAKKNS